LFWYVRQKLKGRWEKKNLKKALTFMPSPDRGGILPGKAKGQIQPIAGNSFK